MEPNKSIKAVSEANFDRITRWAARKPAFALMGEFSAGKSTLMNLLLEEQALPTQVTATQLPPVWFSWGEPRAYIIDNYGYRREIELDEINNIGVEDARFIRIFKKSEILEKIDLIDTPGISDPKISSDVWSRALGQAAGVIWCTHSTQAWRETERATWTGFPERIHQNSILLVTRSDVLNAKDRQKVLRRVNREAGHLFHRTILFSARDALNAVSAENDAELWAKSGSDKLFESLFGLTESFARNRSRLVQRFKPAAPGAVPASRSERPSLLVDAQPQDGEAEIRSISPMRVKRRDPNRAAVTRARLAPDRARALRETVSAGETAASGASNGLSENTLREVPKSAEPFQLSEPVNLPVNDTETAAAENDVFHLDEAFKTSAAPEAEQDEAPVNDTMTETLEAAEVADHDAVEDAMSDVQYQETPAQDAFEEAHDEYDMDFSSVLESLATQTASEQTNVSEQDAHNVPSDDEASEESGADAVTLDSDFVSDLTGDDTIENNIRLVSSIMDETSEDEPEETDAIGFYEDQDVDDPEFDGAVEVSYSKPLNASEMWSELLRAETAPESKDELLEVFETFLSEFDKMNAEMQSQTTTETLRTIARAGSQPNAEWHVL